MGEIENPAQLELMDAGALLEKYSEWLSKNGYMDTDWKDESPTAIDQFLSENKMKPSVKIYDVDKNLSKACPEAYGKPKKICPQKDKNGNCPLHNIHCAYPKCEE